MDGCQNAIVGRPHIVVRAPRIFRRNLMSVRTILIYCWHKANYCILTTGKIILIRINKISIQFWFPRQSYGHIQPFLDILGNYIDARQYDFATHQDNRSHTEKY